MKMHKLNSKQDTLVSGVAWIFRDGGSEGHGTKKAISGVARIFFGGGRPGHLMANTPPPRQWVRGAKAPRTVAKFHFLKRF